jgi:hypothetical protein
MLLGFLALAPLSGVFFYLDTRLLARWQSEILRLWADDRLELRFFRDAIGAYPGLPAHTLCGMLELLPPTDGPATTEQLPVGTRQAVALTAGAVSAREADRMLLRSVAWLLALGCLAWLVVSRSPVALAPLASLPLLLAADRCAATHRFRAWQRKLAPVEHSGIDGAADPSALLGWRGLPSREKERFISDLRPCGSRPAQKGRD